MCSKLGPDRFVQLAKSRFHGSSKASGSDHAYVLASMRNLVQVRALLYTCAIFHSHGNFDTARHLPL